MKSSCGHYFIALDHVRAIAALMVFVWHFTHSHNGHPVPFAGAPVWGPFSWLDEGHLGVSLFMTLSGYLFAKLLAGRPMRFHLFLWNRLLRLAPLLLLVMALTAVLTALRAGDPIAGVRYALGLYKGLLLPVWPSGGWSITVELHFYLLLPLLLALLKRSVLWLLLVLLCALAVRWGLWWHEGEVQRLAYWTLVGRIDQFVLGIVAYAAAARIAARPLLAGLGLVAFSSAFQWFNLAGGFYLNGGYPSPHPLWIVWPTVEGLGCALAIAWYDQWVQARNRPPGLFSRWLARAGEYSYAIYLLHGFVVFKLASWLHAHVLDLSSFYVASGIAVMAFMAVMPLGWLSMRYVEAPFLKLRRPYLTKAANPLTSAP